MTRLLRFVVATLLAFTGFTSVCAQDKSIRLGTLPWDELVMMTEITKKSLENKGYQVEVIEFSDWGIAYTALSKGNVEALVSQVDYVAYDYWSRFKNKLEKISPVSNGLYQGIAVPDYVPVTSIEELNDNSEKFGGKIIGIEAGSGLMNDTAKAVTVYNLKPQLVEGSTVAMTATLKAAIARQEWVAVTVWEPSWMMQQFNLKFLSDPKGVYPPSQQAYWIARKGFSSEFPEAREIISGVFIPLADISAMSVETSQGKPLKAVIASWIENHSELMSRWGNIKGY